MIKDKIKSTLYSGLAALTIGCGCSTPSDDNTRYAEKLKQEEMYSFDSLGRIEYGIPQLHDVEVGDMDGDGDLDLILLDNYNDVLEILENKIPQKNLKNQ